MTPAATERSTGYRADEMGKRKNERREIPIKVWELSDEDASSSAITDLVEAEVSVVESPEEFDPPLPRAVIESPDPFDPPVPPAGARGESATSDLGASELLNQVEALTQEKVHLYDQLLRRQAEFENFRKRTEREREEVYQRARAEVLLELLPVLDNFDRALSSLEQSGGDAEALHHGVELIHKQLTEALAKLGLQPLDSIGKAFDPHLHEAVTIEQTDEHDENTVIEEFERGYKIGDRLLRPAKVKVAASLER